MNVRTAFLLKYEQREKNRSSRWVRDYRAGGRDQSFSS